MAALLDRCAFTPTAGGTSDFAVSAALTGFQTPSAAGAVNGTIYCFFAQSSDLTQWEYGYYTWNSSTTTMQRTTILGSSNSGSKVNFTVAPLVSCAALAETFSALFAMGTVLFPSGSDDTSAINTALAASGGGNVWLSPGVFHISSAITVGVQGTRFRPIQPGSTIIISSSLTADMIDVTASYCEVSGFSLSGPSSGVPTAGWGISLSSAQHTRIENNIIDQTFNGISIYESSGCHIESNKLYDLFGEWGILSQGSSGSIGGGNQIIGNQVDDQFYGGMYGWSSGYGAWSASAAVTAGTTVVYNSNAWFMCAKSGTTASTGSGPAAAQVGTTISDGTAEWYFLCSQNFRHIGAYYANSDFIAFNDLSGPAAAGAFFYNADGVIFIGNTIGQIIGIGVQLDTNATNVCVIANQFDGTFGGVGCCAISDTGGSATGLIVSDNYINGVSSSAISIQSSHIRVRGNTIVGPSQNIGSYAIDVGGSAARVTIKDNDIESIPSYSGSIRIQSGCTYYIVADNQVDGSAVVDSGTGTQGTSKNVANNF